MNYDIGFVGGFVLAVWSGRQSWCCSLPLLDKNGQMKELWGDLTDDDLTKIDGKRENLVGVLQTRYGYTKEKTEADVSAHLDQ